MLAGPQGGGVQVIVEGGLIQGGHEGPVHIVLHRDVLGAGVAHIGGQAQGARVGQLGLAQLLPAGGRGLSLVQIGPVVGDGLVIGGPDGAVVVEGVVVLLAGHVHVEIEHGLHLGVDHVHIGVEAGDLIHGVGGLVPGEAPVGKAALADHHGLAMGPGQLHHGLDDDEGVIVVHAGAIEGVAAGGPAVGVAHGSAVEVGVVGVLIGGHPDPVHILVAGVELLDGDVPVADVVGGEHHLDVGVGRGGVGHLLEGLDKGVGVALHPVVHLGAHPEQDGGVQLAYGPQALVDVAVRGQDGLGAAGALRLEVPGQLDDAAVGSLAEAVRGVHVVVDPVVHRIAVLEGHVHQGGGLIGLLVAQGGAEPGAAGGAVAVGGGAVVALGIDLGGLGRPEIVQVGVHVDQGVVIAIAVVVEPLGEGQLPLQPGDGPVDVAADLAGPGGGGALGLQIPAHVLAHPHGHQQIIGLLGHRGDGAHVAPAGDGVPLVMQGPVGGRVGEGRGADAQAGGQRRRQGDGTDPPQVLFHVLSLR